jgi:transcriptional regulator with XRE-family HTH domain
VETPIGREAGQALRAARRACGLTLRDVGSMTEGVFKPTAVAAYERGERRISLQRFCDLSVLYGVPPERLLALILRGSTPGRIRSTN